MDPGVVDEQWSLAIADSGLAPEACRRYDLAASETESRLGAAWFPPGKVLELSEHFPDAELLDDANRPESRSRHRVAIWPDDRPSVIGARMRHELEHAAQWARFGPGIFRLYDVTHSVLAVRAAGLDGCAGMYINAIPSEQDANAASAMFLRRHHTDTIADLCHDDGSRQLACSLIGPEPIETLPARMIAYIWLFRDCCLGIMEREEQSFDQALEAAYPGAGEYWRRLDMAL